MARRAGHRPLSARTRPGYVPGRELSRSLVPGAVVRPPPSRSRNGRSHGCQASFRSSVRRRAPRASAPRGRRHGRDRDDHLLPTFASPSLADTGGVYFDANANVGAGDPAHIFNATFTGFDNVGLGHSVMPNLTSGDDNVAAGAYALQQNTDGRRQHRDRLQRAGQ